MQANLTNARLFTNPFSSPSIHIYRSVKHTRVRTGLQLWPANAGLKVKTLETFCFWNFSITYIININIIHEQDWIAGTMLYIIVLSWKRKFFKCFVSRLKWLVKLFKKFTENLLFFGFNIKNVDIYFDIQ